PHSPRARQGMRCHPVRRGREGPRGAGNGIEARQAQMTAATRRLLARLRLHSQVVSPARKELKTPADVVRWMTAMQAQDFPGAKWSIGARLPGATDRSVEAALANRSIVRS